MKMKMLCGLLLGTLAMAGSALGSTYTDAATNYVAGWTNGSNGGTGFGAWGIVADSGTNGWAGNGIWDSTGAGLGMGEAFGFAGRGTGYIDLNRAFVQALNTNDSFEFDYGINFDSGSGHKGFNLYANGIEVINVDNGGSSAITVNGNPALANYGTQTMHWVFTQVAPDQIAVNATGRDGAETFATTVTVASGYGYIGALKFYAANVSDDFQDQRQSYFNNLQLTQEGTPPPDPNTLTFTGGTWNPSALGDYPFELTRSGAVGDEIVLTSSNTNSVTVPAGVTFDSASNTVSFNATVVSLTAGDATIVASNVATGAWAEFIVKPVPPTLSFTDGTWNPSTPGGYNYTLERAGAVGNEIELISTDSNVLTVAPSVNFIEGSNTLTFLATVVSVTAGPATIIASNVASGAWAEYVVTPVPPALAFTAGTWNPAALGDYTYTVERTGAVGDALQLSSSAPGVLTVPTAMSFDTGINTLTFTGTVVSLTGGPATIVASNVASGAWAEYIVTPVPPANPALGPMSYANTNLTISTPPGFVPATVRGADCALVAGDWAWEVMTNGVDYTVSGLTNVVIPTAAPAPSRRIIRIDLLPI